MSGAWWEQVKAVMRLELKKTFFARRGIWIYVVALLPVLIFIALGFVTAGERHRSENLARRQEKTLTSQDLLQVKPGMSKEDVIALLGKPPDSSRWIEERSTGPDKKIRVTHDFYHYSDGQEELYVNLIDDKVSGVNVNQGNNAGEQSMMFAGVFQFFFLRLAIFFGCLGIFMNLFRGEVLDRSLHFYFLSPIRREVLMAGKFLAGLAATCTIFVGSEILQTFAFLWHFSPSARDVYLYHNHGLEHAAAYLGVTLLACLGYGSFFLVAGMLFRNPIQPAAAALIWEGINPFLPAFLKQFSVIYYLKSLCPVDIPVSPGTPPVLALLVSNSDPISAPLAVLGVMAVALIALVASSYQVRRMEINYTSE